MTPQLPIPRGTVTVTSASRSSAEMLTKFRSGDSTGVDCRRTVGKMEGKQKQPVWCQWFWRRSYIPQGSSPAWAPPAAPSPYLSIRGRGACGRGRGEHVPLLLLLFFLLLARGDVGAGHGGHGVGAELGVLALGGGHGHDGLSQAAAHGLWGRAGAEGAAGHPHPLVGDMAQHPLMEKGLMRRSGCRGRTGCVPRRCDGCKGASSRSPGLTAHFWVYG